MKYIVQPSQVLSSIPPVTIVPKASVKIVKVPTGVDFRQMAIDFRHVKKAVIVGDKIVVECQPLQF